MSRRGRETLSIFREGVLRRPARGRSPRFIGTVAAADRLPESPEWRSARLLKSNPDKSSSWYALGGGRGEAAVHGDPRFAHKLPFFLLDPATLSVPPLEAAVHETAETIARKVAVGELRLVDLMVCGSVGSTAAAFGSARAAAMLIWSWPCSWRPA